VTVHRDKFLIIKPTRCTNFSKFYFGMKLYVFRTVLSIIRSFSLYTQEWYMSYRFADIYHCCVYSEKLLMMDRVTVRNMQNFIPKNKFEKLVHLVGFITRNTNNNSKYTIANPVVCLPLLSWLLACTAY